MLDDHLKLKKVWLSLGHDILGKEPLPSEQEESLFHLFEVL